MYNYNRKVAKGPEFRSDDSLTQVAGRAKSALGSFALPSGGYDWDVKKFARQVKSKKWAKNYARHLSGTADRLTSTGVSLERALKGMLHNAYGVNIGDQVFEKLSSSDLEKIKSNVLSAVYGY